MLFGFADRAMLLSMAEGLAFAGWPRSKGSPRIDYEEVIFCQKVENTLDNESLQAELKRYQIDPEDWEKFSRIQAACCLIVDDESVTRFRLWKKTGNDDDAWS